MEYVSMADESEGCIFCTTLEAPGDDGSAILYRSGKTFVILNAYPYNTGHLLVAPVRHVADVTDLAPDERADLMEVTTTAIAVEREALGAHGFNVGMNLGRVAGAGIPGHLHVHVVPRWGGDTNFMPVVGDTKVLPEMLADTTAKLRPLFAAL